MSTKIEKSKNNRKFQKRKSSKKSNYFENYVESISRIC